MKLSSLLAQRRALLEQARLANLAFAHEKLGEFSRRIANARLRGAVRLQQAAPGEERYWATLTALHGNQSVIDEHFSDDDIMDLADVIAYAMGETDIDFSFPVEELSDRFLAPVREKLERAGVVFDRNPSALNELDGENSSDCPQFDEGT